MQYIYIYIYIYIYKRKKVFDEFYKISMKWMCIRKHF